MNEPMKQQDLRHGFRLGEWIVKPAQNSVSGPSGSLHLEPRVMRVLLLLAERSGETVTRDELLERIWGTVVGDEVIYASIHQLRTALGDHPKQPRYIQTIPKIGYRMITSISPARPSRKNAGPRTSTGLGKTAVIVATTASASAVGILLLLLGVIQPFPSSAQMPSIAVLPFHNIGGQEENEYFCDGMAEEILNELANVSNLRVISRTSSFAFKDKPVDARQIASELGVEYLLQGSVRRDDDKLRITAQLIDGTGFQVWSQGFNRDHQGVFDIQLEIAVAILDNLSTDLPEGVMGAPTSNLEAYDLYLLGRHYWHRRTPESLEKALKLFQLAVKLDPDFAAAYTGIADSYLLLDLYSDLPPKESIRQAKAAVTKALELDDRLAEAYASLGLLRMHSLELTAAELALRKAIELQPNSSMAHMWLGSVYLDTSRLELGYNEYHEAYMIDPLHPVVRLNLGQALSQMGRDEEAAKHIQFWGTQNPDSAKGDMYMAYLDLTYGRIDTAVARLHRALTLETENADIYFMLAQAYSNLGDLTEAELWMSKGLSLQEAEDSGKMPEHSDYRFEYHFARGEFDVMERLASDRLTAFPDWKTADLDYKRRLSLVWPGASRILAGDYTEGIEILERVFDEGYAPAGLEPQSVLAAQGLRAYAYKQLGQMDRATEILDASVEFALKARAEGWRTPGMSSTLAVIYACQEKYDEALAELNSAVDQGWRNYGFTVNYPVTKDLEGRLEYERVMTRMKEDLEAMLRQVRVSKPHSRTKLRLPADSNFRVAT